MLGPRQQHWFDFVSDPKNRKTITPTTNGEELGIRGTGKYYISVMGAFLWTINEISELDLSCWKPYANGEYLYSLKTARGRLSIEVVEFFKLTGKEYGCSGFSVGRYTFIDLPYFCSGAALNSNYASLGDDWYNNFMIPFIQKVKDDPTFLFKEPI